MAYRFRLWSGKDPDNPVIDMTVRSPNIDHARFVVRNLHMDYFSNAYIPGSGMQNSFSKIEEVKNNGENES